MASTLFLVATPIGNLEDITLRALRVLKEASVVAAEDTRRTGRLLAHYGITTPTTSFYEQNERERIPRLLARLAAGETVALVSDAGTPGISDPGYRLAAAALEAGHKVEAIPGPSAVVAALVSSGLPTSAFAFVGFAPPRSGARDRWLASQADRLETWVFFEAPHRIRETLTALQRVLGDRHVAVARELTKLHEQVLRGPVSRVLETLAEPRGEFTVVVAGTCQPKEEDSSRPDDETLYAEFVESTRDGTTGRRAAISRIAARHGLRSRHVYAIVERAKNSGQ